MANYMAGSLDGRFPYFSENKLEVLSILTNNACNLSCKHCYLQAKKFDKYLTSEEWLIFIKSVLMDISPAILCFSGKEPFLNNKSAQILFEAVRLRDTLQVAPSQKTLIGAITNGTLLHRYLNDFEQLYPDYLDISIDGLPEFHNYIRGKNTFEMMRPNLIWFSKNYQGNLWISHTLLEGNKDRLPEFISYYHQHFGIQRFSIGIYTDFWYTAACPQLRTDHYIAFLDKSLTRLENLPLNSPVQMIMDFNSNQCEVADIFAMNGWANPIDLISSVVHCFDNGLTITMNTSRIPVGLWRSVRVTPEGYWLAMEDLLEVKAYDKFVTTDVRTCNYDAKKLYHMGISSKRFKELMENINCLSGDSEKKLPLTAYEERI